MKILAMTFLATLSLQTLASSSQKKEWAAYEALVNATKELSSQELGCLEDSDCSTLDIGNKACGGPSEYLVVSARNLNVSTIADLANQTTRSEDAYNRRYGVFSDCMMQMPPVPKCLRKICN